MAIMADKLVLLRNSLKLLQNELATKVGISRQTLSDYENKKRPMTWNTFLALLSVFCADTGTSDLLEHFGIYSAELKRYLVSSDVGERDES
jgi:DNA-binding XRE family transcriptional regulator